MTCPFCNGTRYKNSNYPKNKFNGKEFMYVRCRSCRLIYLNSFPDEEDYKAMYPPTYQDNKLQRDIQPDPYMKLPGLRYSYGYQFDLIKRLLGQNVHILDYGCGTGHFIANGLLQGFAFDGAEFNPDYLFLLSEGFPECNFFRIDEVLSDTFQEKYDVIRLSNVFEHLSNPTEVTKKLSQHLRPGGILLVEGPIEDNFCFSTLIKNLYFWIDKKRRPNRLVSAPPYHIFFSNSKNQRQFFARQYLNEIHFNTREDPWPFPVSFNDTKGIKNILMALIAKTSILLTKIFGKNWGNTFIYAGTPG